MITELEKADLLAREKRRDEVIVGIKAEAMEKYDALGGTWIPAEYINPLTIYSLDELQKEVAARTKGYNSLARHSLDDLKAEVERRETTISRITEEAIARLRAEREGK